jgi:hypothetical protein
MKVHYRVHKIPQLDPILVQLKTVQTLSTYFLVLHFNTVLLSSKWFLKFCIHCPFLPSSNSLIRPVYNLQTSSINVFPFIYEYQLTETLKYSIFSLSLLCFAVIYVTKLADHSDRAWDRGFESHSRHGCLYSCEFILRFHFSVCRQRSCDGLIPIQGVVPTVCKIKKLKRQPTPNEEL